MQVCTVARTARTVGVVALGLVFMLQNPAGAASCQKSKLTAAGNKTAGKLKCHATAVKTGTGVSSECLGKVELKFQSSFAKADAKGGCPTPGDDGVVEGAVDRVE